jgi:hypothetical protein
MHLTESEARDRITNAKGDEYEAALLLAYELNDDETPDGIEIHHALYMLHFALKRPAPSWDETRVEIRRRNWIT